MVGLLGCANVERPVASTVAARSPIAEGFILQPTPFDPGSPSGRAVPGGPWAGQPVQGFSGLTLDADGGLLVITDNGYGTLDNSDDFSPRVYALEARDGALHPTLRFALHNASGRVLTGSEIDPESLVRAPDGTFWVGEEFGPSLLHFDAQGVLLDPPFRVSDGEDGGLLRSVDAPEVTWLVRSMLRLKAETGTTIASPDHAALTSKALVEQLHRHGFRVVPWTVNEPERMRELVAWGVDGLITDRPDLALALDAGIEVQGHRGCRGLRPESTWPAFERALELGTPTLEFDLTRIADGGALVWHDARLEAPKCRGPKGSDGGIALENATRAELAKWTCDGLLSARFPEQKKTSGSFAPLTLRELIDLLERWGRAHPKATPPRLNIETKSVHPGDVLVLREHLLATLKGTPWEARSTLQSFDFDSLTPGPLPTVALFENQPAYVPNVVRSGGFENLALSADGKTLYAMLEKPMVGEKSLRAYSFDLSSKSFTGLAFRFPLDGRAVAVGDMTFTSATSGLALERDDLEGKPEAYKRLIGFELPAERGGLVTHHEVSDLMHLTLRDGGAFRFPFWTPEGLQRLPDGRIAIAADNNFPFGRARHPDSGVPDETELLLLELP
jgi:glycerophosphoryl diester phosphodiesterase